MKKYSMIIALLLVAVVSFAQVNIKGKEALFYQPLKAGPSGPPIQLDTVTNTGTSFVTTDRFGGSANSTVIQVVVTKISGTVAGTISLQGSLDGTNWKAMNTEETQTALATITATDASNVYHWRLKGNPMAFYRVTWTGAGTMAASIKARILSH